MSAARRVPSRIGTMTDLSMTISYWGALDMQLLIGTVQSSRKKTAGVRARLLIFRLIGIGERNRLQAKVLVGRLPEDGQVLGVSGDTDLEVEQLDDGLGEIHFDPDLGQVAGAWRSLAEAEAAAGDEREAVQPFFFH